MRSDVRSLRERERMHAREQPLQVRRLTKRRHQRRADFGDRVQRRDRVLTLGELVDPLERPGVIRR